MGAKRRRQGEPAPQLAAEVLRAESSIEVEKKKKKTKKTKPKQVEQAGLNEVGDSAGADRDKVTDENGEARDAEPEIGLVNGGMEHADAVEKPVGLQIYWNLSLRDATAREEAAAALVGELRDAQRAWEESGKKGEAATGNMLLGAASDEALLPDCAPALRYSLSRLVRGVASSRESVRQGFAAALAAVAGSLTCVDGGAVLRLVHKNLEVSSSMKGKDARDVLLGRLFAYGAVIRGFRGRGLAPDVAKELTQQLLSLASQKSFLREPSVSLLIEFVEPLSPKFLKSSVFDAPVFQEWIQVQADKGSPESLLLALKLHNKLPASMRESCALLPGSDDLREIFDVDHLSSLVPVLKESSTSHPRMHSMWPVLLRILLEGNTVEVGDKKKRKKMTTGNSGEGLDRRLATFWEVVVEGALLPSSHERKHLAMELLMFLLPSLGPSSVGIVLSGAFVRCLADVLAGEENLLYKSAQRCLQELCNWAQQDDPRTIAAITSLQRSSHGTFDSYTKTRTVMGLASRLTCEASCKSLINGLVALFLQDPAGATSGSTFTHLAEQTLPVNGDTQHASDEELTTQDQPSTDPGKAWVLGQLCSVFKVVDLEPAARARLQKQVLCFLALHGLFHSGSHSKEIRTEIGEKLEWPEYHITDRTRTLCLERLSSLLVGAQRSVPAAQQSRQLEDTTANQQADDYGAFVIGFLGRVRKLGTVSIVHPVSEDDSKAIAELHAAVEQITKAMGKGDKDCVEKLRAMRSFLVQLLLQLYVDPGSVHEVVAELMLFCQHVFGQLFDVPLAVVKPIDDETPHSMDVLVDVVLSILTHPSARIRASAEHVFKAFSGDLTVEGLQSILRIVRKQPTTMRHKPSFGVEDDDSDEDDGIALDDDSEASSDMGDESEDGEEEADSDAFEDETENDEEADEEGGATNQKLTKKEEVGFRRELQPVGNGMANVTDADDEELSDMDDEQMFKMDVHLSKILQQRKAGGDGSEGSKDVQNQLTELKLRCLSLLEIYLHKNPSSPLVLIVLPSLLQQLSIASTPEGNAQVAGRIGNILQNRIIKVKPYPKGSEVSASSAKELLGKTLRLAARSPNKVVGKIAQLSALWLLKVLQGTCLANELQGDSDVRNLCSGSLQDFFQNKKCRLRVSFFIEMLTRHPWVGEFMLNILLEQGRSARNEFLQCQALQLISLFVKSKGGKQQQTPAAVGSLAEVLEPHLGMLGETIVTVFQKPPEKSSKRGEALGYCMLCLECLPHVYPNVSLVDIVDVPGLLASLKVLDLPQKKLTSRLKSLEERLVAVAESTQSGQSRVGKPSVLKKSKRKAVDRKDPSSAKLENGQAEHLRAGRSSEYDVNRAQKKPKKLKS